MLLGRVTFSGLQVATIHRLLARYRVDVEGGPDIVACPPGCRRIDGTIASKDLSRGVDVAGMSREGLHVAFMSPPFSGKSPIPKDRRLWRLQHWEVADT